MVVGKISLVVVSAFLAAVADLPGFFVVVGGDGCHRPLVAVAGDFSAVIEIIKDAELQSELVQVGSDVLAVHHQRGISVAGFDIAKDLIVGAIFLEDVDHVTDGIGTLSEVDAAGVALEEVVLLNLASECGEVLFRVGYFQARQRSVQKSWDVGFLFLTFLGGCVARKIVGASALSFGGCNQEIVARCSKRAGVPAGRDETHAFDRNGIARQLVGIEAGVGDIEDRDGIDA